MTVQMAIKTGRYTHEKRMQDIVEFKMLKDKENGVTSLEPDIQEEQMVQLIGVLTTSEKELFGHGQDLEDIEKLHKDCFEKHQLKMEIFGSLGPISQEDYHEFFRTTGIDIDGRQRHLSMLAHSMEDGIRKMVSFSKSIPGFMSIPLEDQVCLMKAGHCEFGILRVYKHLSVEYGVFVDVVGGEAVHLDDVAAIIHHEFLDLALKLSLVLKNLTLNVDDVAVLKGIILTFADRCDLQDREKVEEMHWKLVCCLMYLAKENHSNDKLFIAKVCQILCSFRELSLMHNEYVTMLKLEWPRIQQYPLLLEML
ncbi:hypothetical protein ScPMuIL_015768 [Solemya velum]